MTTLHQRRTHPKPVDGCFACRIGTVGVDTKQLVQTTHSREEVSITVGAGGESTTKTDVLKNSVTEHRDGRVDVTVRAPLVRHTSTIKEER